MSSDDVLDAVAQIIERTNGFAASRVTRATRLREDAGIAGDDGDELLQALDDAFVMDWTGIDSGVIFGNEGFGPPPLWLMRNNCILYEPQTLTVGELVDGLRTGRWIHPTPMIPLTGWRRWWVYGCSAAITLFIGGFFLMLVSAFVSWLFGQ